MGTSTTRRRRRPKDQTPSKQPAVGILSTPAESSNEKHNVVIEDSTLQNQDEEEEETTVWEVIRKHPLFWALLLLGIPYLFHLGFRWVSLQHPLAGWRPAVSMEDRRQVLILGSMSSGTSSIAKALRQDMGLEVGHEDSDALWKFVRDGTVSWFHGIRYWHNNNNNNHPSQTIQQLCKVSWQFRKNRQNYGFGPTLFGTPDYNCSFLHPQFHKCHMHACQKSLRREYGCAVSTTDNGGCATPFQTTLLQTRQPWRIVQSLVAKYCWNDDTSEILDSPPQTLKWLLQAMGLLTNNENHCVLQMMDYVMGYYNTILNAAPDIAVYAIESTSPCRVAHMAGLLDPSTTVYAPNYERVQQECGTSSGSRKDHHSHNTNTSSSASPPQKSNVINRGRVSVQDLLPYTTPERLKRLQALYARFEYEYSEE